MTFTYSLTELSDADRGPLMQVRFRLGDTNEANQHIQDEEIEYLLMASSGSIGSAAAAAARHIAMRYAHEATFSVGAYREELTMRAQHFRLMASDMLGKSPSGPLPLARFTREEDKESGRL